MNLYSTHLPVLRHLLSKTDGPILELGMGLFSTKLFHESGRTIVSMENILPWLEKFKPMHSALHSLVYIPSWVDFLSSSPYAKMQWDIVFVDFGGGKTQQVLRGPIALGMRDMAKYVVCHDTEVIRWQYSYRDTLPQFKYRFDYKKYKNWTSVLSDSVDVTNMQLT